VVGGGERQFVTGRAEAADDAEGEVAEIGMLAEGFAAGGVRKGHLGEGGGNRAAGGGPVELGKNRFLAEASGKARETA